MALQHITQLASAHTIMKKYYGRNSQFTKYVREVHEILKANLEGKKSKLMERTLNELIQSSAPARAAPCNSEPSKVQPEVQKQTSKGENGRQRRNRIDHQVGQNKTNIKEKSTVRNLRSNSNENKPAIKIQTDGTPIRRITRSQNNQMIGNRF